MPHRLKDTIGFAKNGPAIASADQEERLREFVNLKLAARGHDIVGSEEDYPFLDLGRSLIASFQEKTRLLSDYLCPVDQAIHDYLAKTLGDTESPALVPAGALVLCFLYTSAAADDLPSVDLGGRRIIKKKTQKNHTNTACNTP